MVVADASSVILLAKASILRCFTSSHDLTIPETVNQEAVERGKQTGREDAYRIAELIDEGLITVETPDDAERTTIEELFGITGGEAAAIALGREHDTLVVIDDRKGINACKALDHPFTTALDVVVVLYENGTLSQETALEALDDVEEYGWYKRSLVKTRRKTIEGDTP